MLRQRRLRTAAETHLMAYLRRTARGPAEFVGLPPWWLIGEGLLAGVLGAGAILGITFVGVWTGVPALADGEGGLVCAAALTLYLVLIGAGRALVGMVGLLAICLALRTPQAAAGVVLAERGRAQTVVVTSVENGGVVAGERGHYLCSVADHNGVPLKVRIWRGCERTTQPGDLLAVVYDPQGQLPSRGVDSGVGAPEPLGDLAGWAAALVGGCVVATARSYRLSRPAGAEMPTGRDGAEQC
ncbi:hypothetical protein [Streptomyces kaempferi]|uniref:DUF3592 domain-containing protein n=1 Tax=Streptomyces kaempferi TaxID=333725 RepID=A0ABW3XSD2_9ACTN